MIRQLVDFVQHANSVTTVDRVLVPPQSPTLLRTLLTDVCARVKSVVVDRVYDGELWPIVESKLRVHIIGRRCFARLWMEHEQGAANVASTVATTSDDDDDDDDRGDEGPAFRLGGM